MRTKRLVMAAVAAPALAGGAGTALAVGGTVPPAGSARDSPDAAAPARAAAASAGPRVVQPYEPVEIYYAFGEVVTAYAGYTVTAYAEDGTALFEQEVKHVAGP
ncbi:hypothetical protein [Streptomyces cavernae]|uniref:hypothetical protein n=1 Tax=Streptomyces cavernae TaxID=2259034 RepID=UPI000FEBB46D|nr:hypothetical protein [Streptomyces cavernae]